MKSIIKALSAILVVIVKADSIPIVNSRSVDQSKNKTHSYFKKVSTDEALLYAALMYAAENDNVAVAQACIKKGIDVNGLNLSKDDNPIDLVYHLNAHDRPIVLAAQHGNKDIVELLIKAGADPDICCCSCITALHQAIIGGYVEIVRILLTAGANPKIRYDGIMSTLELANKYKNKEILELLSQIK
jgi:ankyrin repeat protein